MTSFIAAILPSGSTLSGLAGRRNTDGSVEVLAYATLSASTFMRRGVVRNINQAAAAVSQIKALLEKQLPAPIAQVYTAVGGQSLHGVENTVTRQQDDESIISRELIDTVADENRNTPHDGLDVLDVVPQEFSVDGIQADEPVGVNGRRITARFLNLVARQELKKNLSMCFQHAKVQVVDLSVVPVVQAKAVLSDSEMRKGVALIDLGTDTTSVSVYQKGALRYLVVLPLGIDNIVHDLATSLGIENDEAEQLLRKHGDALYTEPDNRPTTATTNNEAATATTDNKPATITTDDGRTIALSEFNDLIGARTEEILANAWNQVRQSGLADMLNAGVVFTGPLSRLVHLEEAFDEVNKGKVRKTRSATVQSELRGLHTEARDDNNLSALVGLLLSGNENCAAEPKPEPQPEPVVQPEPIVQPKPEPPTPTKPDKETSKRTKKSKDKSTWFGKINEFAGSFFDEDNN